ncbi:tripartite tricarboxylate transporter substrate binding protein [Methylocella sp. CPCC 101449]|uniref:Bug family tripartite tricarboxylate transporter substrate binding protein n=1 Tax=Methylocella sp. CPCC 101449 TaxID=2987531 RepID=UPI00288F8417|nr:tripartite tricarboxylate transporter substrate binding protein [Methylocella sp. CPCC 101449]MDT2020597.1 tripartite tricarboxylate transporter substrate binding protein [Methylocella sp. CPCC 101449]
MREENKIDRRAFVVSGLSVAALYPAAAQAQAYPSKDVHFVLGYAPGSGPDVIARFFAEKLRPVLKTVVVENKPGAGGNIAAEYVARAKPDGYTLHPTGGGSLAASPATYKKMSFDVANDLTMVAMFSRQPTLMVVGPNSPVKTLADLTKVLREKGDKASYGTAFPTARVLGSLYADSIGAKPLDVQYRTSADWITDLGNGALDFAFIDSASGVGHANAGRVRIIAVSTGERSAAMPQYPTMREQGFDIDIASWWSVFAPARTPAAILDPLHGWITDVVRTDDARRFLFSIGNEPWPMSRADAQAFYLKEIKDWADYFRRAGIEKQG